MSGEQRTISPVDGSVLVTRQLAGEREVDDLLDRATGAQLAWRREPLADRVEICRRVVDHVTARAEELGRELTLQMGRPIAHSPLELRGGFQERALHMAAIAEPCLADLDAEPLDGFRRFIRREPLGIVLVVAPWNFPWLTSVNGVVPALLAGNAVVLKSASQTPLVGERMVEAFAAAGLPDGVLQHVHADHDTVARMIGDDRVHFVAFTGSVAGGHAVQRAAADRFVGANLELGGKDPAYVRPDAALDATVEALVDGSFFNAGQSCCAVERIYVHRDLYEPFVARFADLTAQYRLGDPLDTATTLGPMVRASAADEVRAQVDDAVAKGATPLVDRSRFDADRPGTPYLAPQVLVDVDHTMAVMREESFGPVVGIMAVDDDDEAIRLMNDSRYGLSASIWSSDPQAAVDLGARVETGTVYLNRCDHLDPALAWTGVKDSGRGVSLSPLAYEALTRPKSFHLRTLFGE
jgi:acyl-CoA reductase-like NAD-dependent aldehyde dehydrogenase